VKTQVAIIGAGPAGLFHVADQDNRMKPMDSGVVRNVGRDKHQRGSS